MIRRSSSLVTVPPEVARAKFTSTMCAAEWRHITTDTRADVNLNKFY